MKFKVKYYDYDSNNTIEKDCIDIIMNPKENQFSFTPVDNNYKVVIIDRPSIHIGYLDSEYQDHKLKIVVEGYQMIKDSGYWKTKTIISNIEED